MKRIVYIFLIILCVFAVSVLALPHSLYTLADTEFKPIRINGNSQISYLRLDGVKGLCAVQDGVYIADQNAVYYNGEIILNASALGLGLFDGSLLFLKDDGLYDLNGQIIAGEFDTFAVSQSDGGAVIYLGHDKTVSEYSVVRDGENFVCAHIKDRTLSHKIIKLCITDEGLFGLFDESEKTVRRLAENGITEPLLSSRSAMDICAGPDSTLIYLTLTYGKANGALKAYKFPLDKATLFEDKSMDIADGIFASYGGGNIYIATDDNRVDCAAWDSFERKGLYASRFDAYWFYDNPQGVYSRRGITFVADTDNNRIAVFNDTSIEYLSLKNPVSAVATSRGERIAAYDKNIIKKIATDAEVALVHDGTALKIQKLAIDSLDNIYALASDSARGKSYVFKTAMTAGDTPAFDTPVLLSFENPTALGIKADGAVFVYDNGIKDTAGQPFEVECDVPLTDFCIDYSGKIFGLDVDGKLVIADQNGSVVHDCGTFSKIAVKSTVTETGLGGYIENNDLLLLDSATHSLFKISGAEVGIESVSGFFQAPVKAADDTQGHSAHDKIVAEVRYDTTLFTLPIESEAGNILTAGSRVFIRYDISAPADMYYAVAEDKRDGHDKLLSGYIYASALSTPFEYDNPSPDKGKILLGTKAYNYPSRQANDIGTLAKDAFVRLLPFYSGYTDKDGKKWFRIASGDNEAYIPAEGSVDFTLTSTVSDPPNTNATLKEDAILYTRDELTNQYIPVGIDKLKEGTRVQVETPFDSSKPYTKIEVLIDGERYDIPCYVESKTIKFDGADRTQIIVICIIVFLVVLLIVLVAWFTRRKRKKAYIKYYRDEE